jgi:hypothetical protein
MNFFSDFELRFSKVAWERADEETWVLDSVSDQDYCACCICQERVVFCEEGTYLCAWSAKEKTGSPCKFNLIYISVSCKFFY